MGQNAGAAISEASTPIDHVHLRRYTMGNRPLELEVLQLFANGDVPLVMGSVGRLLPGADLSPHTNFCFIYFMAKVLFYIPRIICL